MSDARIKKNVVERHLMEKVGMIPSTVMSVAKKVSAFLNKHNVPHAVAGGMAVSVHGHLRMTKDVDILVPSSAMNVIKQLGKTSPVSGFLNGVSVKIDGIDVDFLFPGHGLSASDIGSSNEYAGLPIIAVEPLVLMKLGAGRMQDMTDIGHLLKLGKVPIANVVKRLSSKEDREDFEQLIEMAKLEKAGDTKAARRLFLGMRRFAAGRQVSSV
jgi:hypothetical protein